MGSGSRNSKIRSGPEVAGLLARTFASDSIFVGVEPDCDARSEVLRRYLAALARRSRLLADEGCDV